MNPEGRRDEPGVCLRRLDLTLESSGARQNVFTRPRDDPEGVNFATPFRELRKRAIVRFFRKGPQDGLDQTVLPGSFFDFFPTGCFPFRNFSCE